MEYKVNFTAFPQRKWNQSCVDYEGGYLTAYREDEHKICLLRSTQALGTIGKVAMLQSHNLLTDPKLFWWQGEIFMTYSTGNGFTSQTQCDEYMELVRLVIDKEIKIDQQSKTSLLTIRNRPNYIQCREKNWTPFEYNNNLFYIYNRSPFEIIHYDPILRCVEQTNFFAQNIKYPGCFGDIRGDSNAIRINDDLYMATFHSVVNKKYLVGYCFFNAFPPFYVTKMCKEPLLDAGKFKFPSNNKGPNCAYNNMDCIFPSALLNKESEVLLSCGLNDWDNGFFSFNKQELLNNTTDIFENDLIISAHAFGDNFILRNNLDKIRPYYKQLKIATNYPQVFANTSGVELVPMQEALARYGEKGVANQSIYNWCTKNKWSGSFGEAYIKLYTDGRQNVI
jgi:hypothetical protein